MAEEVEIDDLDRKILNTLMEDGRKSFRKVAEAVDSTPATVINRVDRLEEEDVIEGYSAELNFRNLGYEGIAAVEIILEGNSLEEVKELLESHTNVVSAYAITGDSDLLALVKFRDREELRDFVQDDLLGSELVEKTITHMALDVLKECSDPEL